MGGIVSAEMSKRVWIAPNETGAKMADRASEHRQEGRPAVYATFSSYDEVAHHSGLERADTLEAPFAEAAFALAEPGIVPRVVREDNYGVGPH